MPDRTPPTLLFPSAVRRGGEAVREALAEARGTVLAERREAGGLATARGLAAVLDALVRAFVEHAAPRPRGFAVLAVGGYGRGDLCPFSDADLLVLARRRTAAVKEVAAGLGRLLWDAGLEVNLTVRPPGAALRAMERDPTLASSFLDRRFVAGDPGGGATFEERVVVPFLERRGAWLAEEKAAEARRRRAARGGCALGLEPDLKESPGGLRDLHLLRWLALGRGAPPGSGLVPGLAPAAAGPLEEAYGTALAFRTELHLLAGRREDLMDLVTQKELVPRLDPEAAGDDGEARHLRVLRPWFRAARTLGRACDRALGAVPGPPPGLPGSPRELAALLGRPGPAAPALRALEREDRLRELLPEWGSIEALPQADPYHAWTVDEHTLRAVEALDGAAAGEGPGGPRLAEEAARIPSPRVLRLALLLHDLGKSGGARGHAARSAGRVAGVPERFGLAPEEERALVRLVAGHTVLGEASALAVRGDDGAVAAVADAAGTHEGLRLLLLLTAADIAGVGRGAWTAWRAAQLVDFHDRVAARLAGAPEAPADLEGALRDLLPRGRRAEGEALLARVPRRYRVTVDPARAVLHLDLLRERERRGGRPAAAAADRAGALDLVVAAADRPHLFADLAGALTLAGLDILEADALTLEGGVALDTFTVAVPVPGRTEALAALEAAAGAPSGLEERVRRFTRRVAAGVRPPADPRAWARREDDGTGEAAEFRLDAPDRPGLLHDLARALSGEGCDLSQVRVATLGPRALDAFRVTRGGRAPAPGPETERLLEALRAAAAGGEGEGML